MKFIGYKSNSILKKNLQLIIRQHRQEVKERFFLPSKITSVIDENFIKLQFFDAEWAKTYLMVKVQGTR